MAQAVFRVPGDGHAIRTPVGGDVTFKLRGEHSGGSLTAVETVLGPGDGPPLHRHAGEDETVYVLDGTVRFQLGEAMAEGGPGTFVFAPRGTPHAYRNVGEGPARLLVLYSPSGMELLYDRLADRKAPSADVLARVAAEVGTTIMGPPMAS